MNQIPSLERTERLTQLQRHLAAQGLDGALLHGQTNLYYYAGTAQQAHLWVPSAGEPVLLVRRVLSRARHESGVRRIEPISTLRQLPDFLGNVGCIGMELDILPAASLTQYQRALPAVTFTDVGAHTRLARSVKSAFEIAQVRLAAALADRVHHDVVAALAEGMSELELSAIAEGAQRRHGFQGVIRWRAATGFECPAVHLLAGESALAFSFADTPFGGEGLTPAIPYGAGRRLIQRGMPVCFDFPTACTGYIHDQTRTLAIGSLDAELVRAHDVCGEIHAMIMTESRPGVTGQELWDRSRAIAQRSGLTEHFMGYGDERVKFVGHGVGLELDELPIVAPRQVQPFVAGNVIAVEPKFFFPGKGAVGLENTYAITTTGAEKLTVTADELFLV